MTAVPQFIGKTISLDDEIFVVVEADNGDSSCISLQNINSGLFLRHQNCKLIETDSENNPKFFPKDSSFKPEVHEEGIALRCSNEGLEDFYICKLDTNNYIINKDLSEYIFKPLKTWKESDYSEIIIGRYINIGNVNFLIVPSNDHDTRHISLLNPENGMFIRHYNGKVIEDMNDKSKNEKIRNYNEDSSFYPESKSQGIILRCTNEGLKEKAVIESNAGLVIGNYKDATYFQILGKGNIMEMLKIIIVNTSRIKNLLERKRFFI